MLLSLELTRASVAAILADASGKPLRAERRALSGGVSPATHWLELVKLARDLCFSEVVDAARLSVVGLAFEGPLSSDGRVQKSPLAPGWEGYDLGRGVREHLGCGAAQIVTASRVVAEAIGEARCGGLQNESDWLWLHLGRHLESVASVRGQVVESDLSALVVERDGVLDDFGRRGTLGAYCGGLAFESRARTYSMPFVQAHEIWALAESNFAAHSLAGDFISRLAQGLSCGLALLKPHQICISGGFGRAVWPLIGEALALKLRDIASPRVVEALTFRLATLGEDGATLGMLALAFEAAQSSASA